MCCFSITRAAMRSGGSLEVAARRSRWCAPSWITTATREDDTECCTPPPDHGSRYPLLWEAYTETGLHSSSNSSKPRTPEHNVGVGEDVLAPVQSLHPVGPWGHPKLLAAALTVRCDVPLAVGETSVSLQPSLHIHRAAYSH